MASKIPAIPSLDLIKDPAVKKFLEPIKETIEIREGRRGGKTDDDLFMTRGEFAALFASSWSVYVETLGAYDVSSHSTDYTLLYADLNGFHLFTGAATVTLPTIITGYTGSWVDIRKRTTGNVVISCSGSDVIVEAGATSLQNTNAAENWASIRLVIESSGVWGIANQLGTWTTP